MLSYSLILCGLFILWLLRDAEPLIKLAAASLLLLFTVKIAALLWQLKDGVKLQSFLGFAAFIFVWPGVLVKGFEKRENTPPPETGRYFLESWLLYLAGCVLLMTAAFFGKGESIYFNYLALVAVLLIVHMGLVETVTDGLRLLGFSPRSLFERPVLARSLKDFWGKRWNRAFVDMNKLFILEPLKGRLPGGVLVFGIFLISGLLHELAISYPAGGPWGFPLLYFAFQGVGLLCENDRRVFDPR